MYGLLGKKRLSPDERAKRKWLTPYKRMQKAAEQGWCCKICSKLLPASFSIDHWNQLAVQPAETANDWENLCALCPTCHAQKSARERELYWDCERERKQGVSKYFQPHSKYFLKDPAPSLIPPCVKRRRIEREIENAKITKNAEIDGTMFAFASDHDKDEPSFKRRDTYQDN